MERSLQNTDRSSLPNTSDVLTDLRKELNLKIANRNLALARVKEEKESLEDARKRLEDARTAQSCLQEIAQAIQQKAHHQVAKVVSKCLSAVFDEPYELRIEFEQRRGKTEADFVYYRFGHKINPRVTSGGVRQVAALALRLVSLVMNLPPGRKFLALDEPFQGLSSQNLQKMAILIETIAEQMDVQFLIVTHNSELQIGKVIQL
jgi:DNA repair exonuclease SbcCD ATPase subunit